MSEGAAAPVRTTCPYCGVGCGLLVERQGGEVAVRGDPEHPANFGRLCSKGAALAETLSTEDRLLTPLIDGRPASWTRALDLVAERFAAAIAEHGASSVALYVSGQLLTEDYYVANKLMKGYVGTANIDTNSRLCMASSVAGHRRAFGSDTVPGIYRDLEEADLVVLVGSNLAWCHPVLYQRLAAARAERGTKVVLVDPRHTMTAELADLHLAIAPDGDVALFDGLLVHLAEAGAIDRDFIDRHTNGWTEALAAAGALGRDRIAAATGLAASDIADFYGLFTATPRVVTVFSQGVNQSVCGTDKVNAIINCHLATGRIGRPGMGPFSVTGQPNAMGGREVGGLATMLAAHLEIERSEHRSLLQRFWGSPRMAAAPGLKAVDLFRAVRDGRIKAVWVMATNPADSMPDADDVAAALAACPFVVVSDVVRRTDTTRFAHVLLPGQAWGEKDGTVTNSERRISRQRPFLEPAGEARPDWWAIAEVARRMGFDGFDYAGPSAIFEELAALSGTDNRGTRDFDISACAGIGRTDYDALEPFQWPARPGDAQVGEKRFFADGGYFTADGRARFVATPVSTRTEAPAGTLVLNTGRIRDHWHTMTRTAKSPRLSAQYAEPFAEIAPADAEAHGIAPADLVRLESDRGGVIVRALVTERQRAGSVFVPMHWTDQVASCGRVDALVAPATDPTSGQPGLKLTHVRMTRFPARWYGFAVLTQRPRTIPADYWALARTRRGFRIELAGLEEPADWSDFAHCLMRIEDGGESPPLAYHDARAGSHRFAAFDGDRLRGVLFIARSPVAASRSWAAEALAEPHPAGAERLRVLAGRQGAGRADAGPTICACFEIGRNQIIAAVGTGALTVEAVGERLAAGTNCGSCRPEIRRLIDAARIDEAG